MSYQSRQFYSPAKFDSDQKDVLISQLKAEIFELRQNERDFNELSAHLKNLEHRYSILSEEKLRTENDLRQRNEQNMKTVAHLRTDIDQLKSNITEKHIENQELRAENLAVKEIADHRALDIARLKNELSHMSELNQRGNQERILLEGEIAQLRDEKRKCLEEIDLLTSKIDSISARNSEQEKLIRELDYQKQTAEKQNTQLRINLENLDFELKQRNDQCKNQNNQLQENVLQISKLQEDIDTLENLVEKYKQEGQQYQKQANMESNKNFELGSQLLNLQNTLKARECHIDDQRKEIYDLKIAHSEAIEQNEQCQTDIQSLKKSLEGLRLQNQELINELENFVDQDEQVRQILNRRSRVKELKLKSESTMRSTMSTIVKASPNKRTASKY